MISIDENTKFKCGKCQKIVNYIEIKKELDLGMHTKTEDHMSSELEN